MGRSRPINIWLSYIFTQNGFDDLENQNRRFQLRAHWLASNPIVNRVGPSSPSMEMGPSRLINIWLSCKFTQNGFHDSQNKNHRFQLRAQLLRSLEVFTLPSQSLALYTSPGWLAGWLAGYIASRTPVQKRSLFYCESFFESYSNRALFDQIRLDPQFGASDSPEKGLTRWAGLPPGPLIKNDHFSIATCIQSGTFRQDSARPQFGAPDSSINRVWPVKFPMLVTVCVCMHASCCHWQHASSFEFDGCFA